MMHRLQGTCKVGLRMNGERLDWTSIRRLAWFAVVTVLVLVAAGVIYGTVLPPILISCFFTYLLLPLVSLLERKRVPRTLAIVILVIGTLGVIILSGVHLVPLLYQQLLNFFHLVPGAINTLSTRWLPAIEQYVVDLSVIDQAEIHSLLSPMSVVNHAANEIQGTLSGLWKTGSSVLGAVLYIVLIPLLTFFMLKDYEHLAAGLRTLVPPDLLLPVGHIRVRLDQTLKSVLKSQAIVAAILGLLYTIGLSVVGLPSGVAIGLISGVCRLIPYGDVMIGGSLCALVLVSYGTGLAQVAGVVGVFVVVQALDGAFITPTVIGERIGLHPVAIILSVLALGDWLGFWGILLAIPVAALVKVLFESLLPYYRASRAYQRRGHP